VEAVPGDVNGLRIGTPELVRLGMKPADMDDLASLIADGLAAQADLAGVADRVTRWRARFSGVHFTA
jgi:glycine hydroxymethyltransferase